jgi:hypothetical protein
MVPGSCCPKTLMSLMRRTGCELRSQSGFRPRRQNSAAPRVPQYAAHLQGVFMKFSHAAAVVAGLSISACGARIDSALFVKAAPTPADQPIKYYSTKTPSCDYQELGLVKGAPKDGFSGMQDVLDGMTIEARRMGGDAIVGLSANVTREALAAQPVTVEDRDVLHGTVIKFTSPGCTS